MPAGLTNCVPPQWGGTELGGDWRRPKETLNVVLLNCSVLGSFLDQVGRWWGLQIQGEGHSTRAVPQLMPPWGLQVEA